MGVGGGGGGWVEEGLVKHFLTPVRIYPGEL